jgi:hypothetical protein
VLDHLPQHAAVATANDEHLLRVRVRVHGKVRNHLLVRKLVPLRALDHVVQHQHVAVVRRLEDEHVLVLRLLVVQYLLDPQRHCLAGPERVADFAEPAIFLRSVKFGPTNEWLPREMVEGMDKPLMVACVISCSAIAVDLDGLLADFGD